MRPDSGVPQPSVQRESTAGNSPRCTYRLQLHAGFTFDDAAGIADYLKDLGASHVYCSPWLQAVPGSTHGYDVVDHHRVNEELGGEEGHRRFTATLRDLGLGQILDIVPNHMAVDRNNTWWWDVLENGPSSLYASWFDIEWQTAEEKLRNKLLLPVLEDHYGRVLGSGKIRIERNGGRFVVRYEDYLFPASPESMSGVLAEAAARAHSDELAFFAGSLSRLPLSTSTDRGSQLSRRRDNEVIRGQIARLCEKEPRVAADIDASISATNADPDLLHDVLERQNYRLSFWRTAERDLGYRRFFDVNSLIGLRVENAEVFSDTHELILRWLEDGILDGVRVDHPDGLRDPLEYLERLHRAAPRAWIVVEKILEPDEPLRPDWPIAGTTGYDFLNVAGGLFVDPDGEKELTRIYTSFTDVSASWTEIAHGGKQLVLRDLLGSDVNRLTALFMDICEAHRERRDYTRHEIHHALRELVACWAVYRTYVRAERDEVSPEDARYIAGAVQQAKTNRPDIDPDLFNFMGDVLFLRARGTLELEFAARFQQFTGTAMAKGVEDTAFYRYNRLISLNEVGGDPGRFGVSPEKFYSYCAATEKNWPATMLAGSTHDTKRSEDVRARVSLLSEIPGCWERALNEWFARNARFKSDGMPDRNFEYLLYQNLLGAWPVSIERFQTFAEKAAREAKQNTSWTNPDKAFESAVRGFIEGIFADDVFMNAMGNFVDPLVEAGQINSLAGTLVRLTAPGVPDIYQGTEIWDLSLVDPDNRRPVDYDARRRLLAELEGMSPEVILGRMQEGLPKLWTIRQALRVRDRLGPWSEIPIEGEKREHLIAFRRGDIICLAPRLLLRLAGDWRNTEVRLSGGTWHNELTGDSYQAGSLRTDVLFKRFPVALLVRH